MSDKIIHNLIKGKWIKSGTWVGVQSNMHVCQMVVQHVNSNGMITCVNPSDAQMYQVSPKIIKEVDGMKLHRFLDQADLTPDGTPIQNLVRRGRKRRSIT